MPTKYSQFVKVPLLLTDFKKNHGLWVIERKNEHKFKGIDSVRAMVLIAERRSNSLN